MRSKKITKPVVKALPAPSLLHSGLRIGALALWLRLARWLTPPHALLAGAAIYLALSMAFTFSFFVPRSVEFSVGKDNCFASPTLLPNLVAKKQGDTFTAAPKPAISLAGYPLYSHTTCITPIQAPITQVTEQIAFSPLVASPFKKNITVSAGELPEVDFKTALGQPVATKDPLIFKISNADKVFEYQLSANGKKLTCAKEAGYLLCDVAKLSLEQSAGYTFEMQRLFKNAPQQTLFSQSAATVGAILVSSSSIAAASTVFDSPAVLSITFNKEIKTFGDVELNLISGETRTKIPVTAKAAGQTIAVKFAGPLARSSSFELSIASVTAPDGGHLPEPLVLPFATSGGPKIKSINIGKYEVSTTGNIVITFDSNVSANQNLAEFIKLDMKGGSAAISVSGNRITINPSGTLPKCTRFTLKVLDGLKNVHGISGGSAWSYSSRTICQSVFSIGTSVQGRSITAYRFGNGGSYVVFVGGTHGNEKSSTYTLNSFTDSLERNYDSIPGHRSIVVIPNLNPDGYAITQRTNANNVDLNRNFPANNWKQGVIMPGGSFNINGGGTAPLSEPESAAVANYILSVSPRLVLTYHAAAGVIMPNDSGDSVALAQIYGQKSNLGYQPSSQTGQIFQYDTTGSMEEWLYDKHGIPTLLVELWTNKSSNEFSGNQTAMWHMATLP
jgi:protein MpaA